MLPFMDNVFLDSSWFKAIIDNKDEFFDKASLILDKFEKDKTDLVTSNFIVDETFTLVRVKCSLEKCVELREFLKELGNKLHIERVRVADERLAWDWFWKDWSRLSFTDCTCFAVMERLGLTRVATFDDHFERAGFEIVSAKNE